jgi:hypothetical protein
MTMLRLVVVLALLAGRVAAQGDLVAGPAGRLSNEGVLRASAMVDSVFIDRVLAEGIIDGGDWASYMLARLGAVRIQDSLGILVQVDTGHIEVRGRLQDLPLEARQLLGPLASLVDSSTVVVADVVLQRTGHEVVRFWLRGVRVSGFPFPELLLASMMKEVGHQYPALTASGRDLYVQVPADGIVTLVSGGVRLSAPPRE